MRTTRLLLTLTLCIFCALGAAGQNAGNTSVQHTVQPGETLYRIAHNYGVTVEQLVAANKGLEAGKIQSGQSILVPKKAVGAASSLPAAKNEEKRVSTSASNGTINVAKTAKATEQKPKYTEYKVKRKDTAYGVAKSFGLTVEQLYEANPEMKAEGYKLKKGTVLLIPDAEELAKAKGLGDIRVAVILPFKGDGVENVRSVEFYRGLLMGIERLKDEGLNVCLNAYAEPAPDAAAAQLMLKVMETKPDVVIGGVYPCHFSDISSVSSATTKVVIPFSSKVRQVESRPELYLLNTPAAMEVPLECDLFLASFKKDSRVIILQSGGTERSAFNTILSDRLTAAKYSVIRLSASTSAETLKLNLGSKTKGRVVVVSDATTENAAKVAMTRVRELRALLPGVEISLVAPCEWLPLAAGSLKKEIHEADTYILAPAYFYPHTTAARAFTDAYQKWFGGGLLDREPRMAPLGYDLALSFLGGMRQHGRSFATQHSAANAAKVLQSNIGFVKAAPNGGYVNRSMWLVHFKPDMSIVKLSAQ